LLRPGGGELDIKYKRYDLTYKTFDDEEAEEKETSSKKRKRTQVGAPSGWVMHEYTIVEPPLQNTVLSHIHLTKGKIKENQKQAAADAEGQQPAAELFDQEQQLVPPPTALNNTDYCMFWSCSVDHTIHAREEKGNKHY
jgi:hypothetical protein